MKKVFNFGKVDGYGNGRKTCSVTVDIELKENRQGQKVFTASGIVWNNLHTDIIRGGQCLEELKHFKSLKNDKTFNLIYGLWERNHLNDLHAGTKEQEDAIHKYFKESGIHYEYDKAVEYLKSIKLHEVKLENGQKYMYGHGWIYREISNDDLKSINELLKD